MAAVDYVEIPSLATQLRPEEHNNDIRPAPKVVTSLPRPEHSPVRPSPGITQPILSPSKAGSNLTSMLLSSALQIPANAPAAPQQHGKGAQKLLSTRDPLSLPITTVNFRRFVSMSGCIFWLQDRAEEIVLWKKGWKYTVVWGSAYVFICYFPRLILLVPHVIIMGVMLATHPSLRNKEHVDNYSPKVTQPPLPSQAGEGSVDWLANLQAIQNLMGAVSDAHDFAIQYVPYLTHSSSYTGVILSFVFVTFLVMIPIVHLLPMRTTCLVVGLFPFFLTHPLTQGTLLPALQSAGPLLNLVRAYFARIIDNDNLEDKHWNAELRQVELWENERWAPGASSNSDGTMKTEGTWSKSNLKLGERKPWTRGRDGWSGILDDGTGEVSNLTFSLSVGWSFVETEDWRPDLAGSWAGPDCADGAGWVYTNDVWLEPHALPPEAWKSSGGMTRRRRWTRRIYYSPTISAPSAKV